MTILKHELRLGRKAWIIWSASVSFLLIVTIFLFPEMKGEMDNISSMFSDMGSFSAAFGMDKMNFGTLIGYYAVECGNVLGLGGAFFASLCAAAILCREEKERTAEFLLTHPVSRVRIISEKLMAVLIQVLAMNLIVYVLCIGSMAAVGESIPWKEVSLLHLAFLIMQIELCGICFGISAFMRKGSIGVGLGITFILYFMNLISNITEKAKGLKYITPFAYCDGSTVVTDLKLDAAKIAIGMTFCAAGIAVAYLKYTKKDIR
ncbi:MAG: ABC transporter permease subunit [Spirochaetales bacterium]|nr:ABC transporter permease subunit [Spirochaetales bacterium]